MAKNINNMTAFNLNDALKGKKVVTRYGIDVTVTGTSRGKVIGKIHEPGMPFMRWELEKWNLDGKKYAGTDHHHDLFMAA